MTLEIMSRRRPLPESWGLVEQARDAAEGQIKDPDVCFTVMSVMIPYHFGSNVFKSAIELAMV